METEMTEKQGTHDHLTFTSQGKYSIEIKGYIDPSWTDRLGGLTITSGFDPKGRPITSLNGIVTDQSELIGILNNLYNMHLPLLSVSFIGES